MDCHEKNPYKKFFGACNEPKTTLDVCFAMEKEKSRRANSEKARKFDEEFERELERSRREKEAAQTR